MIALQDLREEWIRSLQAPPPEASATNTAGKKPKPVTEKQSELIGLRFTPSELEQIKQQAGLVPVATYLKNELITKAKLFTEQSSIDILYISVK